MITNAIYLLISLQIYLQLSQSLENNGNKLGDVIKNHTKSVYNSTKNQSHQEENLLKEETHKLLSECGAETSDINSYDDNDGYNRRGSSKPTRGNSNYDNFDNSGSNNNRRKNSNKRYNNNRESSENGNDRYGNRNQGNNRYSGSGGNDDDNNSNGDSNNRYGNRRNNQSNNRYGNRYHSENYNDDSSDESGHGGYGSNSRSKRPNRTMSSINSGYNYYGAHNGHNSACKDDNHSYGHDDSNGRRQRPYNENNGNYGGYGSGTYGYNGYGNSDNMRREGGPGYNFDANLRAKRSNNDDESDSQCVSQCVFGYLEVLDDNRVPSETLVIKWLQDHISNDMKRMRALREARRCFARLSTSDTEDGCEFSQALSKCLNLELE